MPIFESMKRFLADRRGISSVEYAILLALAAGGIAVAAGSIGSAVSNEIEEATVCVETGTICE